MKNLFTTFTLAVALCSLQACDTSTRPENKTSVDKVNPGERNSPNVNDADQNPGADSNATAAYICPMKCKGSASNSPGKCPVCKMDLVKNTTANQNTGQNEVLNHQPAHQE